MEITVLHLHDPFQVAVWHLQGELDGSNGQALIDEMKRENQSGAHFLVLDFSFVTCLDEAGLAALKSAAGMFCESETVVPQPSERDGIHERVKLLHVPDGVGKLLDETGTSRLFEIYSDLRQALHSFLL